MTEPTNRVHLLRKLVLPIAIAASLSACVSGGAGAGTSVSPGSQSSGNGAPASTSANSNTDAAIPITGSTIPMSQALNTPGAGTGQTIYVSTTGSNSNNGLSPQTPLQTIQQAVDIVRPGGTIEIMGGTYAGGITISNPETATAWITMEPYQNQPVVIDGGSAMNNLFFTSSSNAPSYWEVKGFTLRSALQYGVQIDTPDVKIVDNNIYYTNYSIVKLVSTAHNIVIWGNQLHDNNHASAQAYVSKAVDMVGAVNVLVAHNNVYNISDIGLYCKGNATDITFADNTLNNIGSRGIMLGQSTGVQFLQPGKTYESYNSIIKNNVITNDQSACLSESSSYDAEIYNNSCYNAAIVHHGAIFISNESALHQAGTNVYIRNNIIEDSSSLPMVVIAPHAMTNYATLHINHNMYYDPAGVTFEWDDKNIYNMPFQTWQQTTGLELNSVVANPQYANVTPVGAVMPSITGNTLLSLSPSSPAINAGVVLPSVTHDINGVARPSTGSYDMGAYQ